MTDAATAYNAQDKARIQLGHETRESWAAAARPRRSELIEAMLGQRPMTVVDHGMYKVTYDEPCYVLLEFDQLASSRSSGDVTAELTVLVDGGVGKGHFQRVRLNLLADRSVGAFAKSLSERLADLNIPWAQYLNDAAQWVLTEYRSGEPAILLREAPLPATGSAPLVNPILAADGSTIVFGDGGSAKSYLALALAASLHSGREVIEGMPPSTTRRVGYLDWEWSAHVHRRRLERLWPDADLPDLVYVACRLPIREERDRLRRLVREHQLEYLVVDSVGLAAGGEPESAEVAIGFFNVLRELGCDSLLVAHVNRSDAARSSAGRAFGSTYWHNSSRSAWYVRGQEDRLPGHLSIGLYHRKANDAPLSAPLALDFRFEPDRTRVALAAIADTPDLAADIPVKARMIEALRTGALPIHEVAERIDAKVDTVVKAVQRDGGQRFTKLPGADGVYVIGLAERSASA